MALLNCEAEMLTTFKKRHRNLFNLASCIWKQAVYILCVAYFKFFRTAVFLIIQPFLALDVYKVCSWNAGVFVLQFNII